jgi:Radical SAM ThiC family
MARARVVTPAMEFLAERESLRLEFIRAEIARGSAPNAHDIHHLTGNHELMAIDQVASIKVNANIGNSAVSSSIDEEANKLLLAVKYDVDTVSVYQAVPQGELVKPICGCASDSLLRWSRSFFTPPFVHGEVRRNTISIFNQGHWQEARVLMRSIFAFGLIEYTKRMCINSSVS